MIRLAVRVRRARAELVLAELLELVPAGVEEVAVDEQTIEYATYGAAGELPALPDLTAAAGGALVEISTSELPGDWHERWKRFHHPVLIEAPAAPASPGRGAEEARPLPSLRVRAPWQPLSKRRDVLEIAIDPGQAFGTGAHATTRLCLGLMLDLVGREGSRSPLLDVGTGSGVLAIAGAGLGFSPVLAVDHDRESVAAAQANAAANGVAIEVRQLDVRVDALPWSRRRPDGMRGLVVVANLLRPLLLDLARTLPGRPSHLVLGGLLREEAQEVASAFGERHALRERERREEGDWAASWLSAPAA